MPFKKGIDGRGGKRPGAGRRKGVPNKITLDMRVAYTHFVEANIPNFQRWMDRVAREDPGEALNIAARFSEFCLPKLMRAEVTGLGGAALVPPNIAITFGAGGPGMGGATEADDDASPTAEDTQTPEAAAGE